MNEFDRLRHMSEALDRFRPVQDRIANSIEAEVARIKAAASDAAKLFEEEDKFYKAARVASGAGLAFNDTYTKFLFQEKAAMGSAATAYLESLNKSFEVQRFYGKEIDSVRLALQGAVNPLSTFQFPDPAADLRDALWRINAGISSAVYIGHLELDEEEEQEQEQEDLTSERSDSLGDQLVEVVPAEALAKLRRVDFAPISLLDRVLRSPEAMRALSARDFEFFIAALIDRLGFDEVSVTPRSGDQGRDILATKIVNGISILFAFECKLYGLNNPVGPDILRALLGTIVHGPTKANKGVLVTTSTFTSGARNYLFTEPALDGKDFDGIVNWLHEYGKISRQRGG